MEFIFDNFTDSAIVLNETYQFNSMDDVDTEYNNFPMQEMKEYYYLL